MKNNLLKIARLRSTIILATALTTAASAEPTPSPNPSTSSLEIPGLITDPTDVTLPKNIFVSEWDCEAEASRREKSNNGPSEYLIDPCNSPTRPYSNYAIGKEVWRSYSCIQNNYTKKWNIFLDEEVIIENTYTTIVSPIYGCFFAPYNKSVYKAEYSACNSAYFKTVIPWNDSVELADGFVAKYFLTSLANLPSTRTTLGTLHGTATVHTCEVQQAVFKNWTTTDLPIDWVDIISVPK